MNDQDRNKVHALFPTMPQGVLNEWIEPLVDEYGWPFQSVSDSISGTEWADFLLGRSLSFWSQVNWKLLTLVLRSGIFHPDTISRVDWIVDYCAFGKKTPTANLQNTKKRFSAAATFIQINRKLPSPVVGLKTKEGFEIVDGHHRFAAAVFLGLGRDFSFPAWIAFPEPNSLIA